MGERRVRNAEVGGSNPLPSTRLPSPRIACPKLPSFRARARTHASQIGGRKLFSHGSEPPGLWVGRWSLACSSEGDGGGVGPLAVGGGRLYIRGHAE